MHLTAVLAGLGTLNIHTAPAPPTNIKVRARQGDADHLTRACLGPTHTHTQSSTPSRPPTLPCWMLLFICPVFSPATALVPAAAVVTAVVVVMVLLQETTATSRIKTGLPASTYSAPRNYAPRNQKTKIDTATKVRQGTNQLIDGVMSQLPDITATVRNVTKGATEKQLKNLQRVTKFIGPALQIFMELQTGQNGITFEDRKMLDDVGMLTEYLTSTVLTKPAADPSNKTRELLPDYTDLLEGEETLPAFSDVDAGTEFISTEPEPQRESSFVETSPSFAPSPVSAPSSSRRTFGSFRSSPGRQRQTPISAVSSSTRSTFGSFRSSPAHEKQTPISVFPPLTRTFTSLDASPVTEKPKSKPVLPPLTRTFGSFSSFSDNDKETPTPSFPPLIRDSPSFGSSLDTKKPKPSAFSFSTILGSSDSFPHSETQTPTFFSSPSTKVTVSHPSKFTFSSPRVQASPLVSRPRPASSQHLGAKHFGSSFTDREANKEEQTTLAEQSTQAEEQSTQVEEQSTQVEKQSTQAEQNTQVEEQSTQAPKIQQATVKPLAPKRRYSPSRLLRQQMSGNIQSTETSSTGAPVSKHSARPRIGSRAGSRAGRRVIFSRRRLTHAQP